MAKGKDKSRELLGRLLISDLPTEGELKQFALDCPDERQYFDFKAGALLGDEARDPAAVLRKYVSAFANADGGFLVIGYDQKTKTWDNAVAPGGRPLMEWATRCLSEMPQARPWPLETTVDGNGVLLVAVPRSRSLIPVVEKREPVYYLRIGESAIRVPPYLVADLMLGRRNQAQLTLADASYEFYMQAHPELREPKFTFSVVLDNLGLSFAEDVQIGMVAWIVPPRSHFFPVNDFLRQQVDAEDPPPHVLPAGWRLAHQPRPREGRIDLGPFERNGPIKLHPCYWPTLHSLWSLPGRLQMVHIEAAVYAVARNEEPWWFQLEVTYMADPEAKGSGRLTALRHERPRVSVVLQF